MKTFMVLYTIVSIATHVATLSTMTIRKTLLFKECMCTDGNVSSMLNNISYFLVTAKCSQSDCLRRIVDDVSPCTNALSSPLFDDFAVCFVTHSKDINSSLVVDTDMLGTIGLPADKYDLILGLAPYINHSVPATFAHRAYLFLQLFLSTVFNC